MILVHSIDSFPINFVEICLLYKKNTEFGWIRVDILDSNAITSILKIFSSGEIPDWKSKASRHTMIAWLKSKGSALLCMIEDGINYSADHNHVEDELGQTLEFEMKLTTLVFEMLPALFWSQVIAYTFLSLLKQKSNNYYLHKASQRCSRFIFWMKESMKIDKITTTLSEVQPIHPQVQWVVYRWNVP